jgi:signal peptidase I
MSQELQPLSSSTEPSGNFVQPRPPLVRKKFLAITLLLALVCFSFFKFWLMPVKILGESMYPTYRNGTRHFLNRMAYWSKPPQRGDVIGMRAPDGDLYIKRIIGLPGDVVAIEEGRIIINGRELNDPMDAPLPRVLKPLRLDHDEYFVIGDNRFISIFGPILRNQILGRIVL